MNKAERESFDRKVLGYVRAKGTVCVNEVARHFNKKWETASSSISRLVKKGAIHYLPEMGDNPMFYSIWEDIRKKPITSDIEKAQPVVHELEPKQESNDVYARLDVLWTRATMPTEVIEKAGFVCHPTVRGRDIPPTFVRGHLHGQYLVRIIRVGTVPATYRVPNTNITGGWISRVMKGAGNKCYYGHMKFPDDREKFKFHSMADKDGHLSNLSVYVHPRFIYYKANASTALIEFEQQVKDILNILEQYGWEFGEIVQRGIYSMGYNNRSYAEQMPVNHTERPKDIVHFDSSIGSSSDGCTEAEIYRVQGRLSEDQMDALVEHPQRILDLEAKADAQDQRITDINDKLDKLIVVAEKNVRLTEMTMAVTLGSIPNNPQSTDNGPEQPLTAFREDVMYG